MAIQFPSYSRLINPLVDDSKGASQNEVDLYHSSPNGLSTRQNFHGSNEEVVLRVGKDPDALPAANMPSNIKGVDLTRADAISLWVSFVVDGQ